MSSAVQNQISKAFINGPHAEYFGGRVLTKPKFFSIYLGDYWSTSKGIADRQYLDTYAGKIVSGRYTNVWQQYGAGKGQFIGSAVISASGVRQVVDERGLQTAIQSVLNSKEAPAPDGQTVYTVFLPPGFILTDRSGASSLHGMGGYHGDFNLGGKQPAYFAAVVYSEGRNGVPLAAKPIDNVTIAASHEWTEAVTDPDVGSKKVAWYDRRYGEIGDIPVATARKASDIYGRLDGYAVQKEWSNRDGKSEIIGTK